MINDNRNPRRKIQPRLGKTSGVLRGVWKRIYKHRRLILAVPVGVAAVILALHNQIKLPHIVGVDLQTTGEFARLVSREIAVLGPLAITAACLFLVFCSRKIMYPWLISVFSLVLPLLLLLTNFFAG